MEDIVYPVTKSEDSDDDASDAMDTAGMTDNLENSDMDTKE